MLPGLAIGFLIGAATAFMVGGHNYLKLRKLHLQADEQLAALRDQIAKLRKGKS